MFMKEKFETGKPTTVPFVSTVRGGVRYGINWSFGSTIWKINTLMLVKEDFLNCLRIRTSESDVHSFGKVRGVFANNRENTAC